MHAGIGKTPSLPTSSLLWAFVPVGWDWRGSILCALTRGYLFHQLARRASIYGFAGGREEYQDSFKGGSSLASWLGIGDGGGFDVRP